MVLLDRDRSPTGVEGDLDSILESFEYLIDFDLSFSDKDDASLPLNLPSPEK